MMIELFKDPVAWHVGSYAMFVVTEILLIPCAALQDSLKKADEDEKYKSILDKLFPELKQFESMGKDRNCNLVFTIPLFSDNQYRDEYVRRYVNYINEHATEIYLKKHQQVNL